MIPDHHCGIATWLRAFASLDSPEIRTVLDMGLIDSLGPLDLPPRAAGRLGTAMLISYDGNAAFSKEDICRQ